MAKKIKSISFNDQDPIEVEILEFLQTFPNFSGYVKSLIRSDKQRREEKRIISREGGGIKITLG